MEAAHWQRRAVQKWRRGGDSGGAGGTSRRSQCTLSIGGLGLGRWNSGDSEPRVLSHWSLPPIYCTARQGPSSLALGWTHPIRARRRPSWPLGQLVEINSNILPLDLLLYFHLHIFYFFLDFITD